MLDWVGWDNGQRLIFVAGCVALLSMFLPWAYWGFSVGLGITDISVLFLGVYAYPLWMLLRAQRPNVYANLGCGAGGAVLAVFYMTGYVKTGLFRGAAVGGVVFLLASLALIVGSLVSEHRWQHQDQRR